MNTNLDCLSHSIIYFWIIIVAKISIAPYLGTQSMQFILLNFCLLAEKTGNE